jgi:hypothetical protein
MSSGTFFLLVFGALLFLVWWQVNSLGSKIFCTFRRKDRGKIERFVSLKEGVVNFDGGQYEIDPRKITILKYTRGLIGMFIPIPVRCLDFTWSSRVPESPDDFTSTWDTPDARAMADSRSDWRGMNAGIDTQTGKKTNLFGNWMIWVGIAVVLVIVYFVYKDHVAITSVQKYLEAGGANIPK